MALNQQEINVNLKTPIPVRPILFLNTENAQKRKIKAMVTIAEDEKSPVKIIAKSKLKLPNKKDLTPKAFRPIQNK